MKSDCYRRALLRAVDSDAALMSLNADIVLANGFVRSVVKLLTAGKRVIEVPGPRGLRDDMGDALISNYRGRDGGPITITPADLSGLWIRHMHPQLQMHVVDGPPGESFHPSHLYWPVADEGVIIRGFHLYPIVVYPKNTGAKFSSTIDDDLVGNLGASPDEVFLAQDSRVMFCCELSAPDHHVGHMLDRGDPDRYVAFYLTYARHNFCNLHKEILITGAGSFGPLWDARRRESLHFVKDLERRYRREIRRRTFRRYADRTAEAVTTRYSQGRAAARRLWQRAMPERARRAMHVVWNSLRGRKPR